MLSKQDLHKLLQKEFKTTLSAMNAFPEAQMDFKPHEKSLSAQALLSTIIFGLYFMEMALGKPFDHSIFSTYKPEAKETIITDYEKMTAEILTMVDAASEEDLNKSIEFASKTFIADEMMLMFLFDQIHHRGQLTLYIRLAGGLVPAIYGPSADDTSTNF